MTAAPTATAASRWTPLPDPRVRPPWTVVHLAVAGAGWGDPNSLHEESHVEINEALDRLTEQRP
jgi:hypothetical protein